MELKCCSLESLQSLLDHQLSLDEESAVLQHLNGCSACQSTLESLSAEPQFWNQLGSSLREPQPLLAIEVDAATVVDSGVEAEVMGIPIPPAHQPVTGVQSQSSPFDDENLHVEHLAVEHAASVQFIRQWLAPSEDPQYIGRLGAYEIAGVIGVGGMGIVLKGYDRSLHRSVAIKVLGSHLTASGAARRRFEREAQAAASVVHENVLAIHAIDQWREIPYFVMPLVRGESLEKRLKRTGPLELLEVLRIARQIAAGLSAAHQQGVVHRDIKPANVLMEHGSERLTISDFGLARAGDDASLTRSGYIMGTPLYMSPEQARGERVDARSDVFSFGSLLYALCTGHSPFRAETPYGVIRRLCEEQPRPIQQYAPTIPFWLSGIIAKMMEKNIDQRLNSAAELQELFTVALAHAQLPFYTDLPDELKRFAPETLVPHPSQRNGPVLAWASLSVLTLLIIGLGTGLWIWQSRVDNGNNQPLASGETDGGQSTSVPQNLTDSTESTSNGSSNASATSELTLPRPSEDEASQVSDLAANSSISTLAKDDSEVIKQNGSLPINAEPLKPSSIPQAENVASSQTTNQEEMVAPSDLRLPSKTPKYRFQPDEKLLYDIRLELMSNTKLMEIDGVAEMQIIESYAEAAELNYQLRLNHKLSTRTPPADQNELLNIKPEASNPAASNPAGEDQIKTRSDSFWPGFPEEMMFVPGPRIGPMWGGPFGAASTQPFSFETQEVLSCENSGRAKISYSQGWLGASHNSELPGQLGPMLSFVFPALGKPGNDGLLRSESKLRVNTPDPASPENWTVRKSIELKRGIELQPRPSDPNGPAQYDLSIADRVATDETPSQTLLGKLWFDVDSGKLKRLELSRSGFDHDELIHSSKIRELRLTIQQK